MIDFRYHLVSIVAVFLALAIGIVLGSTELQGATLDGLRQTQDSLRSQLSNDSNQLSDNQAQLSADQKFYAMAEPKLLARTLAGDRIVLVTEPGASSSVVSGIMQAAAYAGATVTGTIALQPEFNDLSGTTFSRLESINSQLASETGSVLTEPADTQTLNQQQAAQLIAAAIVEKSSTAIGLTGAQALNVLAAYAQAGYLTMTPSPSAITSSPATLAVLVTPSSTPAGGQTDPANQVLLGVAQELATQSAATIVAGSTAGSSPSDSAMSVLRSSSVSSLVSSVDDADTTLGQISAVWALADQLAGAKPNSYGVSGASAVSPSPAAVPTTTPSPTTTANPKTAGKAKTKK